jgi:hypothetical protein
MRAGDRGHSLDGAGWLIWIGGTGRCPSPWRPGARLTLVTTHLPPSSATRRATSHSVRFTSPHRIHATLPQLQRPPHPPPLIAVAVSVNGELVRDLRLRVGTCFE